MTTSPSSVTSTGVVLRDPSEAIVLTDRLASALQTIIGTGDLSRLTAQERVQYYSAACLSLGLNPWTRPFQFLSLQGKVIMYATKDATDQIRGLHKVSLGEPRIEFLDGMVMVSISGSDSHGRTDSEIGAVALSPEAKGEVRANAVMKAITKAKRRLTLSLCGLGVLDESELEGLDQASIIGDVLVMDTTTGALRPEKGGDEVQVGPPSTPARATQTAPRGRQRRTAETLDAQAQAIADSMPVVTAEPETDDRAPGEAFEGEATELVDDEYQGHLVPDTGPFDERQYADGTAFIEDLTALIKDCNEHREEMNLSGPVTWTQVCETLGVPPNAQGRPDRKQIIAWWDARRCGSSQIPHLRRELLRKLGPVTEEALE